MEIAETLVLRDASGTERIILHPHEKCPRIILAGSDRAEMVLEMEETAGRIRFRRADGSDSLLLSSTDTAVAAGIFDDQGRPRWTLNVDTKTHQATLSMIDQFHQNQFCVKLPPSD